MNTTDVNAIVKQIEGANYSPAKSMPLIENLTKSQLHEIGNKLFNHDLANKTRAEMLQHIRSFLGMRMMLHES